MLLDYKSYQYLPSAEDLPDSDDTPVDNQLKILAPQRLLALGLSVEQIAQALDLDIEQVRECEN